MKRVLVLLYFSVLLSLPTAASAQAMGNFRDMEFVAKTEIPGPQGQMLALCHLTQDYRIFGYTIISNIQGYALSSDDCVVKLDRFFSAEQMETAQSLNLVDASLPVVAENDMERNLRNYGIWAAIGLAVLFVIIRRIKSLLGYDLRGPMRRKAADRILTAMCYMGKCDGIVSSNEIALIRKTAARLTRRDREAADVIRIADQIEMNLTEQDFIDFGRGLRDSEKDVMMQAVFYIALASGRVLPAEHKFLTQLAHGIGMPGEDFRRVMNIALKDLDAYPATL